MKMKSACIAVLFAWLGLFTATPLADDDSCGNQRNFPDDGIISATEWDELTSCGVTLSAGHAHRCVVTACADAALPVNSVSFNNDYRFVVSTSVFGPGLDTPWERNIKLKNSG